MDTAELQAKVSQLTHLLPSQREWLERVLFQLTFNDCQQIHIVGAVGSGKSTLALALAELLSEQYNIALLSGSVDESQVTTQLMQQWFSASNETEPSLVEQVEKNSSGVPLVLIVDESNRYSEQQNQRLKALNCVQFYFSEHSPDSAELVLTINRLTTADAEQLLQPLTLNSIEISQRLAQASGNMHLILQPHTQHNTLVQGGVTPIKLPVNPLLYGIAAVIFAVLAYVFWPSAEKLAPVQPKLTTHSVQPPITSPEAVPAEQAVSIVETDMPQFEIDVEAEADAQATLEPEIGGYSQLENQTEQTLVAQQLQSAAAYTEPENVVEEQIAEATTTENTVTSNEAVMAQQFQHDEVKLLALEKQQVAIQLAVLSSEAALQRFLQAYPQLDTLSYQRNWQGKMQLVLLLAPYGDAAEAKSAMQQLPQALRETGLFVKTLQAAQAEIRARQKSQPSVVAGQ